jgi:flagellar biogenesis protein FliO
MNPDLTAGSSGVLEMLKVLLMLAGVLVLAWAGLRFWLPRMGGLHAMRTDLIEVVARQSIEARKTLYIVRAGSRHLLLAASDQGVHLLQEVAVDPAAPVPPASPGGFAEKLRHLGRHGQ